MWSVGFRPFFFLAAAWSALAIPLWLCTYAGGPAMPSAFPAVVWHVHEMVFGFGFAAVAGFLLTAIPNWTGRLPLRGVPLALLASLWLAGRVAVLVSAFIGPFTAALVDLAFPVTLALVVAREIVSGRNWRNLPIVAALLLLGSGSLLVHLHALDLAYTAPLGNRLGVATLLMLITLVGGRIVPSFTRNWLAKNQGAAMPAPFGPVDVAALVATLAALAAWVTAPAAELTSWLALAAGAALALRLARWRGLATVREPLLFVLHLGYGWLAVGMLLLGARGLPAASATHALTAGAVGTMTLAVMTRATLGHTGRPLTADAPTIVIYALVTLGAVLRVVAPLADAHALALTSAAGAAWSAAFLLFSLIYGRYLLVHPIKGTRT
jgi:uncharacterized protein involved in response to NO